MKRTFMCLVFTFLVVTAVRADEGGFVYDDRGERDPFWPLVTSSGALVNYDTSFTVSDMTLEGVIADGRGGLAIINGTVVEVGKKYGQYIVKKISPSGVTLEKDGQTTELRLKKEE